MYVSPYACYCICSDLYYIIIYVVCGIFAFRLPKLAIEIIENRDGVKTKILIIVLQR